MQSLSPFLAGMLASRARDPFDAWRSRPAWIAHAARLDGLFREFDLRHARPFSEWAARHVQTLRTARSVFYPFSGPDIVYPHLLYPDARTYLLCGLEICEDLSPWSDGTDDEMAAMVDGVAAGLEYFLRRSYFVTREMRQAWEANHWSGVVPALLVCLARTGHTVHSLESVRLDLDGELVTLDAGGAGATGVRITFSGRGDVREVFYFTQDLRDEWCGRTAPILRFAARLSGLAAFTKSASYLLHEPNFSHVREFLFSHCHAVVQDPSSLPYRMFAERGWHVDLHGRYVRAPRDFPQYEQHDLIAACRQADTMPQLPFGIGYHADPGAATLMVATRRAALPTSGRPCES